MQFSKLTSSVESAKEASEKLEEQMRVLRLHGGEEASADAGVVLSAASSIAKDLATALSLLDNIIRATMRRGLQDDSNA